MSDHENDENLEEDEVPKVSPSGGDAGDEINITPQKDEQEENVRESIPEDEKTSIEKQNEKDRDLLDPKFVNKPRTEKEPVSESTNNLMVSQEAPVILAPKQPAAPCVTVPPPPAQTQTPTQNDTKPKIPDPKLQKYEMVRETKLFKKFLEKEKEAKNKEPISSIHPIKNPIKSELIEKPEISKKPDFLAEQPKKDIPIKKPPVKKEPPKIKEEPEQEIYMPNQRKIKEELPEAQEDEPERHEEPKITEEENKDIPETYQNEEIDQNPRKTDANPIGNDNELFGVSEQVPFNGMSFGQQMMPPMYPYGMMPPNPVPQSYPGSVAQSNSNFMNPMMGFPYPTPQGAMTFGAPPNMFGATIPPGYMPAFPTPENPINPTLTDERHSPKKSPLKDNTAVLLAQQQSDTKTITELREEIQKLQEELKNANKQISILKNSATQATGDNEQRVKELEDKVKRKEMEAKITEDTLRSDIEALQKRNEVFF